MEGKAKTIRVWTGPGGRKTFEYSGFVSLYEMFGWISKECDPAGLCDIAGQREQEEKRKADGESD